jgi:salicylate hydroxylase
VWSKQTVALLGDASHAMLPFAAQGAGMAIEDAATVAKCLSSGKASVTDALSAYARQRTSRVARVQRTARQNGQIYHLRGPMAFARDQAMRLMSGTAMLARQNWIYDWRV